MRHMLVALLILFLMGRPLPATAQALVVESFIRVQIKGLVKHPGLYRLVQGSRTADAIQAAGGIMPGAELEGLNLASALQDGDSLIVPRHEDVSALPAAPSAPSRRRKGRRAVPLKLAAGQVRLNLNSARLEQLDELPGIGPSLARDIVAYRSAHGGFHSLDELREVPGIGDHRLQRLRPFLRI